MKFTSSQVHKFTSSQVHKHFRGLTLLMALVWLFSTQVFAQCPCSNMGTPILLGSGNGVPNLPALNLNLTNACVRISGTLNVLSGQTWNLQSTEILMSTGARIEIATGGSVVAQDTEVKGCNMATWNTIFVSTGASMTANDCKFENAGSSAAITVWAGGNIQLTDNEFYKNIKGLLFINTPASQLVQNNQFNDTGIGIDISGSNNLVIAFNRYFETNNGITIPTNTGILIQAGRNITIDGGQFVNMLVGVDISPVSTSRCIEIKNTFMDGAYGVRAASAHNGLTVKDSYIRCRISAILIQAHNMNNSVQGSSCSQEILIKGNLLAARAAAAVSIDNVTTKDVNAKVTIIGNNIVMSNATSDPQGGSYGIRVNDIPNNPLNNVLLTIDNNTIFRDQSYTIIPGAIYLSLCKEFSVVSNNQIQTQQLRGFQFGIKAVDCPHIQVVGNSINGVAGIMEEGIAINNTPDDILLCCNFIDNASRGLYMYGAHENTRIYSTVFNNHVDAALYYDQVMTSSAHQWHRGNDWSGANALWDAIFNGNLNNTQFCTYRVDNLFLSGTTNISPNLGWFVVTPGAEQACVNEANSSYCGETPFEENFNEPPTEFEITGVDWWAANPLEDESYDMVHWEAQRYLFAKLLQSPSITDTSLVLQAFFDEALNSDLGKLVLLEQGIANLQLVDSASRQSEIDAMIELNNSISGVLEHVGNEKTVLGIHLQALLNNSFVFSIEDQNTLDGIAAQCPQVAGRAVYLARYLQEYYRVPFWNLDCSPVAERQQILDKAEVINKLMVSPNPAFDAVTITLPANLDGEGMLSILDFAGRVVYKQSTNGEPTLVIPVTNYPQGVYWLNYQSVAGQTFQSKIVVSH